ATDAGLCARRQCRDRAGIQSARKKQPDRHIRYQVRTHGIFQHGPQAPRGNSQIVRFLRVTSSWTSHRIPPRPGSWRTASLRYVKQNAVTRWQRKYAFEQGHRLGNASEQKVRGERILRKLVWRQTGREQRANLGRKREAISGLRVVQRLD